MDQVDSINSLTPEMPPMVLVPRQATERGLKAEIPVGSPREASLNKDAPVPPQSAAWDPPSLPVALIRPRTAWQLADFGELYQYRDLFQFLVRREIKVRYAQSAIGVGWAVLQPLFSMIVFSVVFGRLAKISSDGVPYALFSFAGLVPWMYFANSVTDGVNCLITNSHMLSKVYFPRLFLPIAAVAARIVDFGIAAAVMVVLMFWYGVVPNSGILALPLILLLMVGTAIGSTLWLATFAIQYRDVKHAMSFVVQILMYAAPVVYPLSLIPARFHLLVALNPMVGVIEALRAAVLGSRAMPWDLLLVGSLSCMAIGITGIWYFAHRQRSFADVA